MQNNKRPEDMARIVNAELAEKFIGEQVEAVKKQVGDKKVLLALSGGVDSSVVAALLIKAIGKNLVCVHVNHGLLRKGEPEQVVEVFRNQMNANLVYVDAVDRFLDKLAGVAGEKAQDHRRGIYPRIRRRGAQTGRHRISRAGHYLSRHPRKRPRKGASQRRRAARRPQIRTGRTAQIPF